MKILERIQDRKDQIYPFYVEAFQFGNFVLERVVVEIIHDFLTVLLEGLGEVEGKLLSKAEVSRNLALCYVADIVGTYLPHMIRLKNEGCRDGSSLDEKHIGSMLRAAEVFELEYRKLQAHSEAAIRARQAASEASREAPSAEAENVEIQDM